MLLALGSSVGDRRANLRQAITSLQANGVRIDAVSPVFETPAMLPVQAQPEWNVPYLNIVLDTRVNENDIRLLSKLTKKIQSDMGTKPPSRWAPRIIDIDILCFGDSAVEMNGKIIPNIDDVSRPFNITPLLHLDPALKLPAIDRSIFELTTNVVKPLPLWMGVANLTPDSFSSSKDGSLTETAQEDVVKLINDGAHIIDIGGESVRPGAEAVSADTEWRRIEKILHWLMDKLADDPLAPRISVDTRHPETAARAIECGVSCINDVTGLQDPAMLALAAQSDADFVVMHSLSVPPSSQMTLDSSRDPVAELVAWKEQRFDKWQRVGIDLNRIILDPGICFGKNRLQSQQLMQRLPEIRAFGCRVLIGHSRKGFIRSIEQQPAHARDQETVIASMAMLSTGGVDMLRVHDVDLHAQAWLVWAHVAADRPAS